MTQIDPTYHVISQMAANIQFSLSKKKKSLKKIQNVNYDLKRFRKINFNRRNPTL